MTLAEPFRCTRCDWAAVKELHLEYCTEMACQVLRSSFHTRPGWVEWYCLECAGNLIGFGALVTGGPYQNTRTLFEVHVCPPYRNQLMALSALLLSVSKADCVIAQTNDPEMRVVLHQFGRELRSEALVFAAGNQTDLPGNGAVFRRVAEPDRGAIFEHTCEPVGDWVLEFEGEIIATGGYLSHYNRPYVDLYMEVRPDRRRRGFGSYLVQELKRVAQAEGYVPCGRCDFANAGSRATMARAGMVPCAHVVVASCL